MIISNSEIWFCIFNPTAGKIDHHEALGEIKKEFQKNDLAFEIYITKSKGDATEVVRKNISFGYRRFVAIGGDGTIHEVVNGIMTQTIVPSQEISFATIPVGTGNDWAKHHKIPSDIISSVALIKRNITSYQDIGKAIFHRKNEEITEYFNNVAGMAYDAFVVKKLEERKSKPNKFIYIFSVLSYLFKYKLQKATLVIDGNRIQGKFYTINIGICKYSGGGMSLVPHAIHNDGLFALTYAKELSKISILLNTYRFYNETLTAHPKITGLQAKSIVVKADDTIPILLELDGELVGNTPVKFEIITNALKFIC